MFVETLDRNQARSHATVHRAGEKYRCHPAAADLNEKLVGTYPSERRGWLKAHGKIEAQSAGCVEFEVKPDPS
jgi:hypothetical protein